MRLARIGDTVSTKNVMQFGTMAGSKITIRLDNAESMREANRTILQGRWEVTKCGYCGDLSRCDCKGPETGAQ